MTPVKERVEGTRATTTSIAAAFAPTSLQEPLALASFLVLRASLSHGLLLIGQF